MDRPLTYFERIRAQLERNKYPGYGACARCDRPWSLVAPRCVQLDLTRGCFALCLSCWNILDTEERLRYFKKNWITYWQKEPWEVYRAAVVYYREPEAVASWTEGMEKIKLEAYRGYELRTSHYDPATDSIPATCWLVPPVAPEVLEAWKESHGE